MSVRLLWPLLLTALLAWPGTAARALALDRRIEQLHHTAWIARDGAPTEISAIAQTADGFLWLGTAGGLYRFDGQQFERVDLFPHGGGLGLSQNIASLTVGPDGALWIGFRLGGVMRLADGDVASARWYGLAQGLPVGTVFDVRPDRQGQVWAGTSRGLFLLRGDRWVPQGPAEGLDERFVDSLDLDPDDTLWVSGPGHRWYSRAPGASRFALVPALDGMKHRVRKGDAGVWVWDEQDRLHPPPGAGRGWALGVASGGLLVDREGSVWVVTNHGLLRGVPAPQGRPAGDLQHFDRSDGLSADRVLSSYEDRDGTLWFGTVNGLDRFRPAPAVAAPLPQGPDIGALAPLPDGSVLVGSVGQPPARLTADGPPLPLPGSPALVQRDGTMVGAAFTDDDGSAWLGGIPNLWHWAQGRLTPVAAPADLPPRRPVQTLGRDAQGQLWAAWVGFGLRRWNGQGWDAPAPSARRNGIPEIVMTVVRDPQGGFWRGLASGEVVRRVGREERVFDRGDGLDLGIVLCLQPWGPAMWIGGERGVVLWDQGRFTALQLADGPALRTVSGIVQDGAGNLWLNGEAGLWRVAAADVQAWRRDPGFRPPALRLDWHDGVLGPSPQIRQLPSAVLDTTGRLWFSRNSGVYWLDPRAALFAPVHPPQVRLTSLVADGHELPGSPAPTELAAGTGQLRISYTAPLPGRPERIRFRHRLLGLDAAWQEDGEHRQAVFTRLPPGAYVFELQALEPGQWQTPVTRWAFRVLPAWYQTRTFQGVLLLLALAAGWGVYRWRLLAHGRRVQERAEIRLAERERIARELHDHLLQGAMGLTLQVQAGMEEMPPGHPARARLERALERADALLVETRDQVQALRIHQLDESLGTLLLQQALALRGERAEPAIELVQTGEARALCPGAVTELLMLAREAVQNALRHAQARRIVLQLAHRPDGLRLTVSDDGRGLPTEPAPGHWGMQGMRERAAQLGARLSWEPVPEGGTRVVLWVPAQEAYGEAGDVGATPGRALWRRLTGG